MRTMAAASLAGLALLGCQLVAGMADVVSQEGDLVLVGAVARNEGSGWELLGGTHEAVGIASVACRSGTLAFAIDPPMLRIVSAWADTDETLSRAGIAAGASVSPDEIRILFTRQSSDGPVAVGCGSALLQGPLANVWVGGVFVGAQP